MENGDTKKKRQFWLGILISAISMAAIFLFIEPITILNALKTARYGYLALSGMGLILFMIIRAVRWRFMLNNELPWAQVFHIQNIGYMLTQLLPFRLGDVARAVLIGNVPPITLAQGVSTMVVERILDMLFIITLLPFTLAGVKSLPPWMQAGTRGFGIASLVIIIVLIVAINQRPFTIKIARFILSRIVTYSQRAITHLQKIGRERRAVITRYLSNIKVDSWVQSLDDLLAGLGHLTQLKNMLILVLLSILVWLPILGAYHSVLMAVHIQPTWAMTGFTVCAAAFSVALPSSPGQVGVFHAAVTAALVQVLGQPEGASASFAFLYHALNIVTMVILGLLGLSRTGATLSHVVASAQGFTRQNTDERATD